MKSYSGTYKPSSKYIGDEKNVVYRSLWELAAFRWLDQNPNVLNWSSEEHPIPYRCATDGKIHRYFIDLQIWMKSGNVLMVEIKPKKQLKPPKTPKRRSKKYLNEVNSYAKNQSKWLAACKYCEKRGMKFEIWTEDVLKSLGIKIYT